MEYKWKQRSDLYSLCTNIICEKGVYCIVYTYGECQGRIFRARYVFYIRTFENPFDRAALSQSLFKTSDAFG